MLKANKETRATEAPALPTTTGLVNHRSKEREIISVFSPRSRSRLIGSSLEDEVCRRSQDLCKDAEGLFGEICPTPAPNHRRRGSPHEIFHDSGTASTSTGIFARGSG
ncbi:hypothetical protein TIFTF001_005436 [Ficus carica]|uniref:Uncharacterized protein n=1 Tax=Ficus carica TaxID=3494 RepID=A0AA88A1M4_FICCA|nr:hypothetical protein TIFTF001_005436 [Ficus carica]